MDVHMPYDPDHIHIAYAGSGDPYTVTTPLRQLILRGLHDRLSASELGQMLDLSDNVVRSELEVLTEAGLVARDEKGYRPTIMIADSEEVRRVAVDAEASGAELAAKLRSVSHNIGQTYRQMTVSGRYRFDCTSFFLLGAKLLDNDLLDALARDSSLMPPAPSRPRPDAPDARYYFWMIEADRKYLGCYGQRGTRLPWPRWFLYTFGQYYIGNARNTAREEQEARVTAASTRCSTPAALAESNCLPLFDEADARAWTLAARTWTNRLLTVYTSREASLRHLYSTLRSGQYAPEGFAQFMCWYHHIAYSYAIDDLSSTGGLSIPDERFVSAIWYADRSLSKY